MSPHLPQKDRARITVILGRLVSELAGGDEDIDQRTAIGIFKGAKPKKLGIRLRLISRRKAACLLSEKNLLCCKRLRVLGFRCRGHWRLQPV
jgi:hypothetical protein